MLLTFCFWRREYHGNRFNRGFPSETVSLQGPETNEDHSKDQDYDHDHGIVLVMDED